MRFLLRTLLVLNLAMSAGFAQPKVVTDAKAKTKAGKYEEAITQLDAALKTASAKDAPAIKTALAETYLAQGDYYMYNEQLPPFKKYPGALKSYRQVLQYDAKNETAKKNIATIEGIYKSMGRPIPQ